MSLKYPRVIRSALSTRGMSVLELLTAISVVSAITGLAVASFERNASSTREAGAARAFAMRVRQARLEAIQRSANVALHFVTTSPAPSFRAYVDGNGNGVRTREITAGVDPPLGPVAALDDGLGGVRFARAPDIPGVGDDDGGTSGGSAGAGSASSGAAGGAGDDPSDAIRVGSAGLLSFAATGSGTSGTIYLRGAMRQYAVRIYGPTGRVRLLEFDRRAGVWLER